MANVKDLLVNGSARVIGTIYGNATSANKVNHSLTFGSKSFNGSSAQTITLADLGGKPTQSAVSSPSASGTEISFIDTISQNANGVISATKKTVRDASASQSGVVSTGTQTFAGNKTFTGQLIKNGVSSLWVRGRDNALLRMNSITGYSPAISIKTTNGSWDIGAFNNSSYTDDLIFSYITDANYNSGNNTTTAEIKFLENGHIAASLDGNATTATNADKLDNKHANEFIYYGGDDTNLGYSSPASTAKTYFTDNTKTPLGMIKGYYNHNGVEYSQLYSRATSGVYGSILRWGYADKYLYILRYYNGNWQSDDWEKISAGHADTATTANTLATARNIKIGNKTNSFNGSADITYNLQDILISAGNEFNYTSDGISDLWFNYRTQTWTDATTKITNYYFANGQRDTSGVTIHASNFSGNAATASKVNNKLTVGSKTYDGSAAVTISASDLGLSSAMLFLGTTTTVITDGATTNPVAIGGSNKTVTAGNVVLYGSKEFVWTGSAWEELGNEGSYKIVQSAVGDPSASGTSNTFIATISQDTNGKITATKKTVAVTNSAPALAWGTTSTIGTVAGTNLQVTMPANPNTDNKVTQNAINAPDYNYWRPLIWGASNSSTEGFTPSTVTDGVYTAQTLSCQPSSGTIRATTFKGNATSATKLSTFGLTADTIDNVTHTGLLFGTISSYAGPGFGSNDAMIISMAWNSGNNYGAQIAFDDISTPNMYVRNKNGSWSSWAKALLSTNYTDYTVKKDGTGASGTWGINISGNAATATNADKLDGYHRAGLYSSPGEWIKANGYTKTVTVNGDSNTYYPVVITTTAEKSAINYISVWKDLGSQTASYSGNHSNGTSSMWLVYEARNWYWDGNGGYLKCWYYSMPYANLCAKTETAYAGVGSLVVYLRGGGTTYNISTTYNSTATVYLEATNISSATYPVNVAPTTELGNLGKNSTTVLGYGDISGNAATATKLATARTISLTGSITGSGTFDGSGNLSIATVTNHTHNYAGSSSAGGSANSAVKLDTTTAGDSNTPVYFSGGKPVACTSLDLNTSGNAATASKLTDLHSGDLASSTNTWRRVWFAYNDNTTGRPAYSDNFVYQSSTNTLKVANIQGNASTATKFASTQSITLTGDTTGTASSQAGWSISTTTSKLSKIEHLDTAEKLDAFIEAGKLKYATVASVGGVASDGMIISVPWNNSWGHQVFLDDSAMVMQHRHKYTKTNSDGSTAQAWSGWATLLDSSNYTNYTVTKTGGGASGTWGININGNAATATALATTRTIWGQSFNGTADITGSLSNVTGIKTNNRFYPYIGECSGSSWYKITLPYPNSGYSSSRWMMVSMDITIGGPYSDGASGTIFLNYYPVYYADSAAWTVGSMCATAVGVKMHSSNIEIRYNINTPNVFFIKVGGNGYRGISIQNLHAHDNAPSYDFLTTRIETSAAPNTSEYPSTIPIAFYSSSGGDSAVIESPLVGKNVSFINDSCNTGYDAMAYFRHYSNNDWCVKIDSGSFDYGLNVITNESSTYGILCNSRITGNKVYGAVWNDYAEYRKSNITEPGRVVIENGDGTLSLSTKRLQRGAEVISDTYGFAIGETDECKTPIAATGRVLAYTYEPIEEYRSKTGWPVCSGPNGTVSIMTEEEEEKYPSRIIGTISEVPNYEEWGSGKVKTNGRVWIRIK